MRTWLGLMVFTLLGISISNGALAAEIIRQGYGYHGIGAVEPLGFWGKPFPYGYQWSLARACSRYEPEEGPRGTTWRRVWVCNVRPRSVVYR
jgi:hypothetical protein